MSRLCCRRPRRSQSYDLLAGENQENEVSEDPTRSSNEHEQLLTNVKSSSQDTQQGQHVVTDNFPPLDQFNIPFFKRSDSFKRAISPGDYLQNPDSNHSSKHPIHSLDGHNSQSPHVNESSQDDRKEQNVVPRN
ncbi:MAG: hypothetical protein MHMPM18_001707 [Marteilia pararefringens]